jgi:hypothetical protein
MPGTRSAEFQLGVVLIFDAIIAELELGATKNPISILVGGSAVRSV